MIKINFHYMKNILSAFFIISAISCEKDAPQNDPVNIPVTYLENRIEIRVQDAQGVDLLSDKSAGCYLQSDIIIIGRDDEQHAVFVNQYPDEDYNYLRLVLNSPKIDINKGQDYEEEVITRVKFGDNQVDEIRGMYELKYHKGDDSGFGTGSGYTIILQQAWFNDNEIYEIQAAKETDWELPVILKELNNE